MESIAKDRAATTVFFAGKRFAMIDGIRSKLATMDAASRKGAKVNDAKSPVQVADAATVELTAVRDAGGSKAPVDAGKVAAIRDAIRNNAYPVDYQKLADRMIETDILRGGRR